MVCDRERLSPLGLLAEAEGKEDFFSDAIINEWYLLRIESFETNKFI